MQIAATGVGQVVVETGAPTRCPSGHELRAGTMLLGFDSPDPATQPRVRTVECRACAARWFDGWGWR